MVKKLLFSILFLLTGFIAIDSSAITIVNKNSKPINYVIGVRGTCSALPYSQGELSQAGTMSWTGLAYYHPDKVCVHVWGWTSTLGEFAFDAKNDNCVITVVDAGMFRGIKLVEGPGC